MGVSARSALAGRVRRRRLRADDAPPPAHVGGVPFGRRGRVLARGPQCRPSGARVCGRRVTSGGHRSAPYAAAASGHPRACHRAGLPTAARPVCRHGRGGACAPAAAGRPGHRRMGWARHGGARPAVGVCANHRRGRGGAAGQPRAAA
ncbi:hypothetical protein I4F81_002192 [Pyropia yezoensis]|uniref:Uncharacterized protein n=1 Tax=Pyropia yezoensis TaxID=2788 RepID=A0ACC3BP53_PYRYE|nr:hypothetical protein I4F81_002192 [Neopyropia yezoensis]